MALTASEELDLYVGARPRHACGMQHLHPPSPIPPSTPGPRPPSRPTLGPSHFGSLDSGDRRWSVDRGVSASTAPSIRWDLLSDLSCVDRTRLRHETAAARLFDSPGNPNCRLCCPGWEETSRHCDTSQACRHDVDLSFVAGLDAPSWFHHRRTGRSAEKRTANTLASCEHGSFWASSGGQQKEPGGSGVVYQCPRAQGPGPRCRLSSSLEPLPSQPSFSANMPMCRSMAIPCLCEHQRRAF